MIPAAIEAESSVLGCVLLQPRRIREVAEELEAGDFGVPPHVDVFAAMLELSREQKPADIVFVADRLKTNGSKLDAAFLVKLAESVSTAENLGHHVRIVKDRSRLRQIAEVASAAISGVKALESPEVVLERTAERLSAIAMSRSEALVHISEIVPVVLADIESRVKNQSAARGLLTGVEGIDNMLHGLLAPKLIVIAARPGVGKTALAMQAVVNSALNENAAWMVVNLEMSRAELVERTLAYATKRDSHFLRTGSLREDTLKELRFMGQALCRTQIYLEDDVYSLRGICARARAWRTRHPKAKGGLVVDYVQLADGDDLQRRDLDVAKVTKGLKRLAKELDIPVIALSQLNRESEKLDRPPRLSDLRESGAIEQDADIVILGHRTNPEQQSNEPLDVDFIVAKHRGGQTGTISTKFTGKHYSFEDAPRFEDSNEHWSSSNDA